MLLSVHTAEMTFAQTFAAHCWRWNHSPTAAEQHTVPNKKILFLLDKLWSDFLEWRSKCCKNGAIGYKSILFLLKIHLGDSEKLSLLVFSLLSSHFPNPFYTHCPFTLNPHKQFSSSQVLSQDHISNSNYVINPQRSTNVSLNFWLLYTCSLSPEENMPAGT